MWKRKYFQVFERVVAAFGSDTSERCTSHQHHQPGRAETGRHQSNDDELEKYSAGSSCTYVFLSRAGKVEV